MQAARPIAPPLEEPLPPARSWAEICAHYPDQHVYMVDVVRVAPSHLDILGARVLGAGASWQAALEQARLRWQPDQVLARRHTGRPTEPLSRPTLVLDDETRNALRPRR